MSRLVGKKIAVWFSCGAASAVAAKLTVEQYGQDNTVMVLNNPVIEEHPDNYRFKRDVALWIGSDIQSVRNPKYMKAFAREVWEHRKFMSGNKGAPCTGELKKKARQLWELENPVDWHVLGFTADERKRHNKFVLTERENLLPVLIDAGMTKQDCMDYLLSAGVEPPKMYKLGYPNANCLGCVKATSPTYWNKVRETHPAVFDSRAKQSREIGAKLVRVKGKRIFLDELDPNAQGQALKSMTLDCGTFCEEQLELTL